MKNKYRIIRDCKNDGFFIEKRNIFGVWVRYIIDGENFPRTYYNYKEVEEVYGLILNPRKNYMVVSYEGKDELE